MRKAILFIVLFATSSIVQISYGLAEEQVGPDSANRYPTAIQPDWPKGIVEIPRHESRVYSIWVHGNDNFYFKATAEQINELISLFSKARMRDHVVRICSGMGKTRTFGGEEIEYNVSLQIVGGYALFVAREEKREGLPLEPELTILTGEEIAILNQLRWPGNVIVQSELPGVSIKSNRTRPKRDFYYGRIEFEDGSPPVGFVQGIERRITLWEKDVEDGINVGSVNSKGYFTVPLSSEELAKFKKGKLWLTITIANSWTEARKTDQRFRIEMLTRDKDKAQPVKVREPKYYYGRILFEDGSSPILEPVPWPGAEIRVDFPYAGDAAIDSQGYFQVYFTKEQYEEVKARKVRENIYIPDYSEKGQSTARFAFPVALLSEDKAKAGVVKIPRPKLPRQELATAESKIGKSIPGFNNIRFDVFREDQAKDKPVIVCFWDIDQRPSRQCILMLEKQKGALQDKNIVVLSVHCGTKTAREVREWLKENGVSLLFGTVEGDPYDTLLAWGAKGLPWLILTDEQHIITKAGFSLDDS